MTLRTQISTTSQLRKRQKASVRYVAILWRVTVGCILTCRLAIESASWQAWSSTGNTMCTGSIDCMSEVQGRLSFDEMVDALADVRRRKFLFALLEHNPIDDSGVFIADTTSGSDGLKHHQILMHQVHLPKLASYGLVTWTKEDHEVTKGPAFAEIRPLLELLRDHEDQLPVDCIY